MPEPPSDSSEQPPVDPEEEREGKDEEEPYEGLSDALRLELDVLRDIFRRRKEEEDDE